MRWTKNLNLEELLAMGTRTWSFYFVSSKYLDYKQYYMMLLEQCWRIVAKDLFTVTCFGRGPISCLLGHVIGLLFCIYVNIFLFSIFTSADFRNSMFLIVLDTELTEEDTIKEVGLHIDGSLKGFSFCPSKSCKPNKQTTWITSHLHGIAWDSGKLDFD